MTTTATLTITEFILSRIAEDEAVARAQESDMAREFGATEAQLFSPLASEGFGDMGYPAIVIDSTRVLAECEAHRRIVALHGEVTGSTYYYGDDTDTTHGTPACEACGRWDEYAVRYPCPTLRILAAVHSDHPDYCEDWRP